MSYGETKVYFDGSHYIAIPHTERLTKKRPKPPEETITVIQENDEGSVSKMHTEPSISLEHTENLKIENLEEKTQNIQKNTRKTTKITKKMTKKEFFNELYQKYIDLRKKQRREKIIDEMLVYFNKREYCETFVDVNLERKQRNLICRRVRMCRKANLANFNYFCTFTYDDKKHTEETFKKKLRTCFRNLCYRNKWKYMGVWERAPETKRLHFHGLFEIPENEMVGELFEHSDYNLNSKRRTKTIQNKYFNEKFGRSDFEPIACKEDLYTEIAYIIKYLEKTGEKIVYSKGLPQYFISDILDADIVCTIGQEDKKLLLFDDFMCLDEGVLMGKVSPEVIEQMRKCNN